MIGLGRIFAIWGLLALLMVANGVVRETILARLGGRALADVVSAALGIIIVLGVTRHFLHSLAGSVTRADLLRTSAIWLALTVAFEFGFGHYVDHKSWSELIGNYAIWSGRLWPLVLAVFVASPFIWLGASPRH